MLLIGLQCRLLFLTLCSVITKYLACGIDIFDNGIIKKFNSAAFQLCAKVRL